MGGFLFCFIDILCEVVRGFVRKQSIILRNTLTRISFSVYLFEHIKFLHSNLNKNIHNFCKFTFV